MPHRQEQRRHEARARYLAEDKIADICKAMGCSKSWLYTWRKRYETHGLNWAKDRSTRPRTSPAKTPHSIEQAVVSMHHTLIQNGQRCGAVAIEQALQQQGLEPVPARRTIYRMLTRHAKEVR